MRLKVRTGRVRVGVRRVRARVRVRVRGEDHWFQCPCCIHDFFLRGRRVNGINYGYRYR